MDSFFTQICGSSSLEAEEFVNKIERDVEEQTEKQKDLQSEWRGNLIVSRQKPQTKTKQQN